MRLCDKCGGANSAALFHLLTTEDSITKVAMDYYISERSLNYYRKRFFESWYR